jgi:hypothetical protein
MHACAAAVSLQKPIGYKSAQAHRTGDFRLIVVSNDVHRSDSRWRCTLLKKSPTDLPHKIDFQKKKKKS